MSLAGSYKLNILLQIIQRSHSYLNMKPIIPSSKPATPRCSPAAEWINRLWHLHIMDYLLLSNKKNTVLMYTATWKALRNVTPRKRSQTLKCTHRMFHLYKILEQAKVPVTWGGWGGACEDPVGRGTKEPFGDGNVLCLDCNVFVKTQWTIYLKVVHSILSNYISIKFFV